MEEKKIVDYTEGGHAIYEDGTIEGETGSRGARDGGRSVSGRQHDALGADDGIIIG